MFVVFNFFFYCFDDTIISNLWITSRFIIFNRPSAYQILRFKTKHTLTAVVRLVSVTAVLHVIGQSNMNEKLHDLTPSMILLDDIVSLTNVYYKDIGAK
jgi:hypothetical protein